MDALSALFDELKKNGQTVGNFQGFLHVLIGRKITRISDATVVSKGMGWRDMAAHLKKIRWDPEAVRELGINPDDLPPRDRQRYWYSAIMQAKVDATVGVAAGNRFAAILASLGYDVGPPPHA
jgi:glycerol kinase